MAKQSERRAQTRAALLGQACELFLENGYSATTTQMIIDATGLSKGALYYHFRSKAEIMEALYEQTSRQSIATAVASVTEAASNIERLKQAAFAWLKHVREPEVARILFDLGPKALGWQRAKEIEDQNSLKALTAGLEAAAKVGEIEITSAPVTARMLNSLLAEAALLDLEDTGSRSAVAETLNQFFGGVACR